MRPKGAGVFRFLLFDRAFCILHSSFCLQMNLRSSALSAVKVFVPFACFAVFCFLFSAFQLLKPSGALWLCTASREPQSLFPVSVPRRGRRFGLSRRKNTTAPPGPPGSAGQSPPPVRIPNLIVASLKVICNYWFVANFLPMS